jgi:hypothetical protein
MVGIAAAFACSRPTGPLPPPPTLLVTNATCESGACRTLQIRAFVGAFVVPQLPVGLEVVGEVHTATACLAFPASWTLSVATVGSADTTFTIWTPNDPAGIYLFAVDSALFSTGGTAAQRDSSSRAVWPYDGAWLGSVGSSATFIPGHAAGWSVTFPSKSQTGLAAHGLAVAAVCKP